jgi:hypothetical protein
MKAQVLRKWIQLAGFAEARPTVGSLEARLGNEGEVEPPVLKHGPRSLILVRVDGFKSLWRNESDTSQGVSLQEKPTLDSFLGLS